MRKTDRFLLNYEEGYKSNPSYVDVEFTVNSWYWEFSTCVITAQDLIDNCDGVIVN